MLNGMEFQTVGAAYLKALRPTAVLVNGMIRTTISSSSSSSTNFIATQVLKQNFRAAMM